MISHSTRTHIEDISMLKLLERELRSFSHVVTEVMDNIESNYAAEMDRLRRIREILIGKIQAQRVKIESIKHRLNKLIAQRNTMHHYEGAALDREHIRPYIEGARRELSEEKGVRNKLEEKLKFCKKLIEKLSAQKNNQYLSFGKKPMDRLTDSKIPRACNTLDKIHELMIGYLSYSSPIIRAGISQFEIKEYLQKQESNNQKKINTDIEKDKINEGREIFEDIEIKKKNGVKWMRVGFKKAGLDFNTQTLASLEIEAVKKRCDFITIQIYGANKNFFINQGYIVYENPILSLRWKGDIAYKVMHPDVKIDNPEILFTEEK